MKILKRDRLPVRASVVPGDSIQLIYQGEVMLSEPITKQATYDEGVLFEDDGHLFGKPALGGAFLEADVEVDTT